LRSQPDRRGCLNEEQFNSGHFSQKIPRCKTILSAVSPFTNELRAVFTGEKAQKIFSEKEVTDRVNDMVGF